MLPSKMVQMRFTPTRGFQNQNGSVSQTNSRSHTPSAKHDNDSPDAQSSFIASSMSLFGVDDDLDEPFTGRNHFALYMERIARESHGQSSATSGSSPELFVRPISAPMTTPVKTTRRTSNETSTWLRTEEREFTNGSAVFSEEESITLQTVQETTSAKKTGLGNSTEDKNNPPHSPVAFRLNRPCSPEKIIIEEESKFETKVSSIVGLETTTVVQVEANNNLANNASKKNSIRQSPKIPEESNLNTEQLSLEVEEKNEVTAIKTPESTTKLGTPLTNRLPRSAVEKFDVVAKSPSTDGSAGSRRASLGSDDSKSTPRTRRRKQQLLLPQQRLSLWSTIQANKIRFIIMFVGSFVFIEVFNLWWHLVSIYSPKDTLERDLKEIIFWFIFSCFLILFLVFFRR